MKNLIYQFWTGDIPYYAKKSAHAMRMYAEYVGADHTVLYNAKDIGVGNSHYHNCFHPIHDESFWEYDNVLFCDMDIFPVEKYKDNIFEEYNRGIGMVEEWHQPEIRYAASGGICGKNDEEWASRLKKRYNINLPRDEMGRLRVYNSGVVVYNNKSLELAKKHWPTIDEYQSLMTGLDRFYSLDQNYLGAMAFLGHTEFSEMDIKWNSQVHYNGQGNPRPVHDNRVKTTQFVHIQLRGRNTLTDDKIYDIVNKPVNEWRHRQ
jgi:hypothetical protein